ncbi:hypothetical protein ABW19_dt0200188 [Dactylella cylindrospora]|nr:hypothetical protein ABW19_dt0200188 [Dactylella cylindrospora]
MSGRRAVTRWPIHGSYTCNSCLNIRPRWLHTLRRLPQNRLSRPAGTALIKRNRLIQGREPAIRSLGWFTKKGDEDGKTESLLESGARLWGLRRPEVISYPDPIASPTAPIAEQLPLPEAPSGKEPPSSMPAFCPGCGAKSQSESSKQPGYYGPAASMPQEKKVPIKNKEYVDKKQDQAEIYNMALSLMPPDVKELIRQTNMNHPAEDAYIQELGDEEEFVWDDFFERVKPAEPTRLPPANSPESKSWLGALEANPDGPFPEAVSSTARSDILCCRCRNLRHHEKLLSEIPDTTYAQAAEIIANSPFTRIHIYHAIDAADFPLSVLPNAKKHILQALNEIKGGKKKDITMSYVITRADVLLPTELQVQRLMTYIRRVLSNYLGEDAELKDLRVVSAKRTWTTERLKDEVRARKGGIFLLGRTNVGKSRLYEAIFPKRNKKGLDYVTPKFGKDDLETLPTGTEVGDEAEVAANEWFVQNGTKVRYPEMPLVSKIPGTTVGPITIDFAAGRGQLVDLPGFPRAGIMKYVRPDRVKDAVLLDRKRAEKCIIPCDKHLVIGGLVVIKPIPPTEGRRKNITFICNLFTNLPPHVAKPTKVEKFTNLPRGGGPREFAWGQPEMGGIIQSAGRFKLTKNVTKKEIPWLPGRGADEWVDKNIAWKVMAADILIEGCGWVEVFAQVGKDDPDPEIEVLSPEGKGIACREAMGTYWEARKRDSKPSPGSRPKLSMKGAKKHEKIQFRSIMEANQE